MAMMAQLGCWDFQLRMSLPTHERIRVIGSSCFVVTSGVSARAGSARQPPKQHWPEAQSQPQSRPKYPLSDSSEHDHTLNPSLLSTTVASMLSVWFSSRQVWERSSVDVCCGLGGVAG